MMKMGMFTFPGDCPYIGALEGRGLSRKLGSSRAFVPMKVSRIMNQVFSS